MGLGILVLICIGCYIAPFVIGSMMAIGELDEDIIPLAAGILITSILATIAISIQKFPVDILGSDLAKWSWVPSVVGLPLGYAFGWVASKSRK